MNLEDIVISGTGVDLKTLSRGNPLTNQVQQRLVDLTFLDPPVDGDFGPVSKLALQQFAKMVGLEVDLTLEPPVAQALLESDIDMLLPVTPRSDLAGRIFRYMRRKNYFFARLPKYLNIVYVEGVAKSGVPNDDRENVFNDRRIVLVIEDGRPVEKGNWTATTEPGKDFTERPMNPKGAARIAFGQFKSWRVGVHNAGKPSRHEALVQVGNIRVHRDLNKDYKRTGDAVFEGSNFGVNQHHGFDRPEDNIGPASAGCLVGRSKTEHKEFMQLIKTDPRLKASQGYKYITTVIAGDDLHNAIS
ncbi:MAG TPA: peptidoglycan-binding domain-containing protein [Blastocatellia bacterium]|nr:peptidoglycan-binding domain-containing protein [Blastocatellia bacterium]